MKVVQTLNTPVVTPARYSGSLKTHQNERISKKPRGNFPAGTKSNHYWEGGMRFGTSGKFKFCKNVNNILELLVAALSVF